MAASSSFDDFAAAYEAAVAIERDYSAIMRRLPEQRETALDIGCGGGGLTRVLATQFGTVVGLDLSATMLELARQADPVGTISFIQADAEHLPELGSFDLIVSHTTFHHLSDISRILAGVRSRLNPGGRLIVIDCVRRLPRWIPRWRAFYWILAALELPGNLHRHGFSGASTLLKFRLNKHWTKHRQNDRYLSVGEFIRVFSDALPGACFFQARKFLGVSWDCANRVSSDSGQASELASRGCETTFAR